MIFYQDHFEITEEGRLRMARYYRQDEAECVQNLLKTIDFNAKHEKKAKKLAIDLVEKTRKKAEKASGVEALIAHYDLSTEEGVMLMCVAEALLRIPDKETENLLIRDKLSSANWESHLGKSQSTFVNMATWGLALTGKILDRQSSDNQFKQLWKNLVRRSGEPVIRQAVHEAVKIMGEQFVVGRDIKQALKASKSNLEKGYLYSYDMLGEIARTQADADRYFDAYQKAIIALGENLPEDDQDIVHRPSISVKLSALYPRYEFKHRERAIPVLIERLHVLAKQACQRNIGLTMDAEEANRLEMSLDIFEAVFKHDDFVNWDGLGLAVQAYQKRALSSVQWLISLARKASKRISVRLVKGAYWDTEIKLAQMGGFDDYPVFTRKNTTDLSYLVCAQTLLQAQDAIYPQFATHNAYSVAAILTMMDESQRYDFEFQSLQGMGRALHDQLIEQDVICRIYGPVGHHEDLLPYLVRRLLENGANSSFVHQIADPNTPIEKLTVNPIEKLASYPQIHNPKIPLPKDIYSNERQNSRGLDESDYLSCQQLSTDMTPFMDHLWEATPLQKSMDDDKAQIICNPSDLRQPVGRVLLATSEELEEALQKSTEAFAAWDGCHLSQRVDILLTMADLLEQHCPELMSLAIREAGKSISAAISEVREAVDFCRYYGKMALKTLAVQRLPGPTGETNDLYLHGRGPLLCISPWNFPIAIFTGQIAAALVAGNTVIAKPAEQTPLVAARVVELFHQAGIPESVLQLLPGPGETIGAALVADPRIQGVLFTGSTDTAKAIQRSLAERPGPIVPLIAETGGINVMIADSTALPEQLVADVLMSAFDSAGQRCSALRVLCLQEDIAESVITMLRGAMAELVVGNPLYFSTDVGPVIDADAEKMLTAHIQQLEKTAKLIYKVDLSEDTKHGTFIAPQAYELSDLSTLKKEVFGPVLHVVRYRQDQLDALINSINALGYGLTCGIQSRIDSTVAYLHTHLQAGNFYVNRNMIGAVVGVQPFGGCRLSGTGPKAGGPHYLTRLCQESTLSINTTATGGNAALMSLSD